MRLRSDFFNTLGCNRTLSRGLIICSSGSALASFISNVSKHFGEPFVH